MIVLRRSLGSWSGGSLVYTPMIVKIGIRHNGSSRRDEILTRTALNRMSWNGLQESSHTFLRRCGDLCYQHAKSSSEYQRNRDGSKDQIGNLSRIAELARFIFPPRCTVSIFGQSWDIFTSWTSQRNANVRRIQRVQCSFPIVREINNST